MIVAISTDAERGAVVADRDDLTRLHVEAPHADDSQAGPAQTDAALKASGLGYLEGEQAWLSVAALRDQGAGSLTDWAQRYEAMIDYAKGKGWCSADGTHLQAHVEWTQRKADA